MASLDTRRPAAQEQLRVLGEQTGVATLPIIAGQTPLEIARRAEDAARTGGYDVVIYDTAGRVTIDEELMDEVRDVKDAIHPHEVLLVADALTGQDAVNTAKAFDGRIGITGIVLTRADGDGRGGAALSMRAVTGKPIKLMGVGEKWDALEDFHPGRIASRILGMGDVVSLVEKAAQTIDVEKATKIAEKMKKGSFDLEDLAEQLKQMQKLGGMGGVLGLLPGIAKIKGQINEAGLDKSLVHQRAIISSMTPQERRNPKILDARRKRRIAAGSGTKVEEINKLLKMHRQMADMMKAMGRNGGMLNRFLGRTGAGPSEAEMETMQAELRKLDPRALEQLPEDLKDQIAKGVSGIPSTAPLPGLGRGLPGLGGGLPKGLPGLGGMPKFPGSPGKKR
jgi:signal recognition particle subunit SRP54